MPSKPTTYPAGIAARLRREILTGELPRAAAEGTRQRPAAGRQPHAAAQAVRIPGQEGLVAAPLRSPVVADPSLTEVLDEIAVLRQLEIFSRRPCLPERHADEIDAIAAPWRPMSRPITPMATRSMSSIRDMRMHTAICRCRS